MLLFASDFTPLVPIVFTALLDGCYFILFIGALLCNIRPSFRKTVQTFIQILAWAGIPLLMAVVFMAVNTTSYWTAAVPGTMIGVTALLVIIVVSAAREIRRPPVPLPPADEPQRPGTPEDW